MSLSAVGSGERYSEGKRDGWARLALGILVLFLFRDVVFGGRVFFERDIHMNWHPQIESFVRALASGAWPFWNLHLTFGQPLLASHTQVLYPFTWLNLLVPPATLYTAMIVVHFGIAALGLYALGRHLGLSIAAAFVAGAVWITSGPMPSLVNAWNHLVAAAFIPWSLLAADLALRSGSARAGVLCGAALAAQILAGSPDLFLMTSLILSLHVLALHVRWQRDLLGPENRRLLLPTLLALGFALALSAGQWLPMLELSTRSSRWGLSFQGQTAWSVHPFSLIEIVTPFRWNDLPLLPQHSARILDFRAPLLRSIYLGIPACALLLAAYAGPASRLRRYLTIVMAGAILVALGKHSLVHEIVATLVPPAKMIRFPAKALIVASFAWSILAGLGFEEWRRAEKAGERWLLRLALPLVLLVAMLLAGFWVARYQADTWGPLLTTRGREPYTQMFAHTAERLAFSGALAFATMILALLSTTRRWRAAWISTAVVILALADLIATNRNVNPTAPRSLFTHRPEALQAIQTSDHSRIYVDDYTFPGLSEPAVLARHPYVLARMPAGWSAPAALALGLQLYLHPPTHGRWGLHSSYDHDLQDLYPLPLVQLVTLLRKVEGTPTHLRLLQMGSVSHALALRESAWTKPLVKVTSFPGLFVEPIQIFKVPDPLPRTYVVGAARIVDGAAALAVLADPSFDPRREVLLPRGTTAAARAGQGTSRIALLQADRVRLEVDLGSAGYVVLVDTFDPGWKATIDGRPSEVLRANLAFRAVFVPAGQHVIEYVYRPTAILAGLTISVAALLLAMLGLLIART